ncbi:Pentatricopeptide repeat-containing protein [Platanthera guangdongensis]|uniref:Pentatricopeptide repeat-containing protein n=1 Tax=Platanthera guangdongensis TaxID=2320717 RepID=A0ABR2MBC9_9ASPA
MALLVPQYAFPLWKPFISYSPSTTPEPRNPNITIRLQTKNLLPLPHPPSLRPTSSQSLHQPNLQQDWLHPLQTCIKLRDVGFGLSIHAFLLKCAADADSFHGNNLINMYSKFCMLDAAHQVFDKMPVRNTVSWTSLISGYSSANDFANVLKISHEMHECGEKFTEHTCSCILSAVKDPVIGEQIHALAMKVGVDTNVVVATSLVSMYASNGETEAMELVFAEMVDVDIRCLNSLILGYKKNLNWVKAFLTFRYVLEKGLQPNEYTFTNTLSACNGFAHVNEGRQLHGLAIKCGTLCEKISVGNAVILMYGKHGSVTDAGKVFDKMRVRNLVSFTTILPIRAKNGFREGMVDEFVNMLKLGVAYDSSCLSTVLDVCSQYRDFKFVSQFHAWVCKLGHASDVFVATALSDAYAKSGRGKESRLIFYCLPNPNIASFNATLDESLETFGTENEIMVMFNALGSVGLKPDAITCSRLLRMSANLSLSVHGRAFHAYGIKSGLDKNIGVSNAVISMYGKCGFIGDACTKFSEMIERDNVTWNAIISAHAIHGRGMNALYLYENMIREGIQPDESTLISILQACSHSGLFDDGITVYQSMQEIYGITPTVEHHVCLVDLLGRRGDLKRALEFIEESKFRDKPQIWRSMVNVCNLCNDLKFGKIASKRLIDLAPDDSASYIMVVNMYSKGGVLEEAANLRVAMRDQKLRKETGYSWISFGKQTHSFMAGGIDHLQIREIQECLLDLSRHLKEFEMFK